MKSGKMGRKGEAEELSSQHFERPKTCRVTFFDSHTDGPWPLVVEVPFDPEL